jgi:agmatinase
MSAELARSTFLGLDPEACTYERSRVVLLSVPYDGTASFVRGARGGPAAILSTSEQLEEWDLELGRAPCEVGIHIAPPLVPGVSGPEQLCADVQRVVGTMLADQKFVVTLGGEHTVTVGAARACRAAFGPLSFLQIDAHVALRDSYEGSRYSHACVARRLLDLGTVVAVGPRVACEEELRLIAERGLSPVWGHEVASQRREQWIAKAIDQLGPRVYVTVDVDGLDPSVIAATGTPVPGGLSWYDALALLRTIAETREVIACDLVELAPAPGLHASDFAATALLYKMIGYFVR